MFEALETSLISRSRRPCWGAPSVSNHKQKVVDHFILEVFSDCFGVEQGEFPFAHRRFANHRGPTASIAATGADGAVDGGGTAANGCLVALFGKAQGGDG